MTRPERQTQHDTTQVVMVRITVNPDGTLAVTIDGAPYEPPQFSPAWQRSSFPMVVDAISQHTGRTLRVDVIETDGRVFTEFYPHTSLSTPDPEPPSQAVAQIPTEAAVVASEPTPPDAQFAGWGFLAGEDVAVAVVVSRTESGPDGIARATIDARYLLHAPPGEIVLVGRMSATVCMGNPS